MFSIEKPFRRMMKVFYTFTAIMSSEILWLKILYNEIGAGIKTLARAIQCLLLIAIS